MIDLPIIPKFGAWYGINGIMAIAFWISVFRWCYLFFFKHTDSWRVMVVQTITLTWWTLSEDDALWAIVGAILCALYASDALKGWERERAAERDQASS